MYKAHTIQYVLYIGLHVRCFVRFPYAILRSE